MARARFWNSVVTRLVAALVLGGLAISLGLSAMELQRAEPAARLALTQQVAQTARNIQNVLRGTLEHRGEHELRELLELFVHDPRFLALRLQRPGRGAMDVGDFPHDAGPDLAVWQLSEHAITTGAELALDRVTRVEAPFVHGGEVVELTLLVDGPAAKLGLHEGAAQMLASQWLLLAVMTLMGLLLLRRWFAGPLEEVVALVGSNAGPEPFYNLAQRQSGEFNQLAQAIGGMLTRLDCTAQQLRSREHALENLYRFAPAAMVSTDRGGRIVEANRRAAELLRAPQESALVGQDVMEFVEPHDRGALRAAIERIDAAQRDPAHAAPPRCELRLRRGSATLDALVECSGVHDEDGLLTAVRLSLQDVSPQKQLQRRLAEQGRLLNLVLDHMSDAILLVDAQGTIAAHNQQLATLLQSRSTSLTGQRYDAGEFWSPLGVAEPASFVQKLAQIAADDTRPAQERFETRIGTLLFRGVPVHEESGQSVGRLWIVSETSGQDQSLRASQRQKEHLHTLRKLGQRLADAATADAVIECAAACLFEALGVEAMGVALRRDDQTGRGRRLMHRGNATCRLESSQALLEALEKQVMPQVMQQPEAIFWNELPKAPWSAAAQGAGLTCLAAAPLQRGSEALGILWIGQRGGERLEPHHVFMLEAAAPLIAAHLEIAHAQERLSQLELTDSVTALPNQKHFRLMAQRYSARPGGQTAVLLLKVDHFRAINERLEHHGADMLLRSVAAALKRTCRRNTFLARLEGATFGLICSETTHEQAQVLAQRLRSAVAELELPGATTAQDGTPASPLSASLGLATTPRDAQNCVQAGERALDRLHAAKRLGSNCIVADDLNSDQRRVG